jgi:hypothetical protein
MNPVPVSVRTPAAPLLDEDAAVPEELIGLLLRATDTTILDLTEKFTPQERANLAVYCYHKAHLRRTGLAIAKTCDRAALVQQWGTVLGGAVFTQSREPNEPSPVRTTNRPKVTLARSAGPPLMIFDIEDPPDGE